MADLIDSTRANQAIFDGTGYLSLSSNESTLVGVLITAASKAIKRYCRREFDSQTFDELYDGFSQPHLQLNQFPVISVARVAGNPTTVLEVTNTSSVVIRAAARVSSAALVLTSVTGPTTTTSTLTF